MADIVKSVEFFEINTTATTMNYNLTKGQDYNNCIPFFSNHGAGDYLDHKSWDCYFSGTSEAGIVNFYRYNSRSTEGYVKGFVVEFDPDEVYVEQGTFDIDTATDDVTTTSGFNPERTALVHHWWSSDAGAGYLPRHTCRGRVVASGTLEFHRLSYNATAQGHWFIFEAKNDQFTVEHVLGDSQIAGINYHMSRSYDPLKTFIISSITGGYDSTGYMGRGTCYTKLNNRDSVLRGKFSANHSIYMAAQTIEFQDEKIHVPFASIPALSSAIITEDWDSTQRSNIPVDLDYSMVINTGGRFDYIAIDNSSTAYIDAISSSVKFTGTSGIQMEKR